MKFQIKKSRSSFRKIGSYASYASCASYAYCAGHMKRISAQHPSPPLRRINQPFQRVDAAYALVIGGRIIVKRQNQFGV